MYEIKQKGYLFKGKFFFSFFFLFWKSERIPFCHTEFNDTVKIEGHNVLDAKKRETVLVIGTKFKLKK